MEKKPYIKPSITTGNTNWVFEAMRRQVEEYKKTGMINGRKIPEESPRDITCRQCSACHGCR